VGRPSQWGNPFVLGKDGTRQEMFIGAVTHPATLDKTKFTFNKSMYPGIYVEDLRID